jgi:hypothetical protein
VLAVGVAVGVLEAVSIFLPQLVRTKAPITITTVRLFFTKFPRFF